MSVDAGCTLVQRRERIDGDGVYLRKFSQQDIDAVLDTANDTESMFGFFTQARGDYDQALHYVRVAERAWDYGWMLPYAIVDAETDQSVGMRQVNLTQVAFGRVTVGAWVAPSFRRKGYSLRSLNAVVDWLRTEKSVFRVDAFVHEANEASYRVLEKAGFEREGVLRNWEVTEGKSRDMLSYAYLIDRS